jgi:hypothetical protein
VTRLHLLRSREALDCARPLAGAGDRLAAIAREAALPPRDGPTFDLAADDAGETARELVDLIFEADVVIVW